MPEQDRMASQSIPEGFPAGLTRSECVLERKKTHKSIPVFYDRQYFELVSRFNFKRENKMHGRRCYDRTYPCSKGQFIENTRKHITSDLNIAGET